MLPAKLLCPLLQVLLLVSYSPLSFYESLKNPDVSSKFGQPLSCDIISMVAQWLPLLLTVAAQDPFI